MASQLPRPAAAPRRSRRPRRLPTGDRALRDPDAWWRDGELGEAREAFDDLVVGASAPRLTDRLPVSARCAPTPTRPCRMRSSRHSPGSRHVSRRAPVRGLVHADPRERLRGPAACAAASRPRPCLAGRIAERAGRPGAPRRRSIARSGLAWRNAVNARARTVARSPARRCSCSVISGDHSPRDISMMTGMRESTVRVHLFRAVHKLRAALGAWRDFA